MNFNILKGVMKKTPPKLKKTVFCMIKWSKAILVIFKY